MHAFRAAVESGEFAHRPYHGRDMIASIISAVANVLKDFRFEKEILQIQGCDFVHTCQDGLIDKITVMLRPLKAVTVLADRMSANAAGG
jgi:hypothetical protein